MADFWIGVLGNEVASVIAGGVAWFWKIRPHLRQLHAKLNAVHDATVGEQ